jgi:hypothetical protein
VELPARAITNVVPIIADVGEAYTFALDLHYWFILIFVFNIRLILSTKVEILKENLQREK